MTNSLDSGIEAFIEIEEAAEELGLSVHTIRKYAQEGRIPYYQNYSRGPLLFLRPELREWNRRRKTPKRVVSLEEAVEEATP